MKKPLQAVYLQGRSIGHFEMLRSSARITSGRTIKQSNIIASLSFLQV